MTRAPHNKYESIQSAQVSFERIRDVALESIRTKPRSLKDLMGITGYKRTKTLLLIRDLKDLGLIHAQFQSDKFVLYHFGQSSGARKRKKPSKQEIERVDQAKPYGIKVKEIAPGHRVARFGDQWTHSHGLSNRVGPSRSSTLGWG